MRCIKLWVSIEERTGCQSLARIRKDSPFGTVLQRPQISHLTHHLERNMTSPQIIPMWHFPITVGSGNLTYLYDWLCSVCYISNYSISKPSVSSQTSHYCDEGATNCSSKGWKVKKQNHSFKSPESLGPLARPPLPALTSITLVALERVSELPQQRQTELLCTTIVHFSMLLWYEFCAVLWVHLLSFPLASLATHYFLC